MTRTLNIVPLESSDLDPQPTLDVLIAYEDLDTGKRGKQIYDFLVENLGSNYQISNQMWKFEVLSIPHLREMATKDAARADLVIISCHGGSLPSEVQAWIEVWLTQPHRPFALVALFDDEIESSEAGNYLAGVAKRGKMEYFAQPADASGTGPTFSVLKNEPENRLSPELPSYGILEETERSAPRWGINE